MINCQWVKFNSGTRPDQLFPDSNVSLTRELTSLLKKSVDNMFN
nr:MAG TPA: hypothetical protein [Caudoviricetes sp.]